MMVMKRTIGRSSLEYIVSVRPMMLVSCSASGNNVHNIHKGPYLLKRHGPSCNSLLYDCVVAFLGRPPLPLGLASGSDDTMAGGSGTGGSEGMSVGTLAMALLILPMMLSASTIWKRRRSPCVRRKSIP